MTVLPVLVTAPALVAAIDSLMRVLLVLRSRGEVPPASGESPGRCLVVIPARDEGARLRATLESVLAAARGHDVATLLLLDGDDPEAAAIGQGVDVVVKEPAGPSKGAALAWLVREHRARLEAFDVVLLLDAGSRLAPDFFNQFLWPAGADAVQASLSGAAPVGVGAAAAASENFAQSREDRGRESLGWNVRLRGTGSAFRPRTFVSITPRLVTRVEDCEASLLITADGGTIRMAPRAIVFDDKPVTMDDAAAQRARWLLGRGELLVRHFGSFVAIGVRHPGEGLAQFAEIFGRPLSLSIPLRAAAAAFAVWHDQKTLAAILAGTALLDVALHASASRGVPRGSARFAASWMMALLSLPRAMTRWLRVER